MRTEEGYEIKKEKQFDYRFGAATLKKIMKILICSVRFGGFKFVLIKHSAVRFCDLHYPLHCRLPLHYLITIDSNCGKDSQTFSLQNV